MDPKTSFVSHNHTKKARGRRARPVLKSTKSELRLQCLDHGREMRVGLGVLKSLPHDRTRQGNVTCIPLRAVVGYRTVCVPANGIKRELSCRRSLGGFHIFSIRPAFFVGEGVCVEPWTVERG